MDLKALILAAQDIKREAVEVPEWGVTVYVSAMTGRQRSAWAEKAFDAEGNTVVENMRSRLLVHCLCDADGNLIFGASDEEMNALDAKNGKVLNGLLAKARKINGLEADAVETAEKN